MGGILVVGGGGHAKVVIATLLDAGEWVAGVLDDDAAKWGQARLGVPILGGVELLNQGSDVRAVMALGDNRCRESLAARFPHVTWVRAVHPSAVIHPSVEIGVGTVVFAGGVIQPDTRLGRHCILNTGATVDHDCDIGDFVHLAPGTHLAGTVKVGTGCFMGVGVSVIPGIQIGAWSTLGAGAVVVSDLPSQVTAVGVPARPLRLHAEG